MEKEAQLIAIAEACGFTVEPCTCMEYPWRDTITKQHIPDYLSDLNAMHEAENWLKEQPDHQFSKNCIYSYDTYLHHHFGPRATAAQRAEAFLKVLNLWVD